MNHDALIENARALGITAGKLRAAAEFMERQRKVILAREKERHRYEMGQKGERCTEARLDDLARCSKDYADHIEAQREAEEKASAAEEEKWAAKHALDFARSAEATAREEMRQYGPDAKPKQDAPYWPAEELARRDEIDGVYG